MKRIVLLAGAAFVMAGCAHDHFVFSRPNTGADQINQDLAACQLYAMNNPGKLTDAVQANNAAEFGEIGMLLDRQDRHNRETQLAALCMQIKGYRARKAS